MFAAVSDATKPGKSDSPDAPVGAPSGDAGAVKALRKVRSDTASLGDLAATLARIERRQTIQERVALRVVDILAIHDEKLDAILEAATRESGPSPVVAVLTDILESLREQQSLLEELPGSLAEIIRDEWPHEADAEDEPGKDMGTDLDDPETEPAAPGRFDGRTHERH
jgi:hypothetical protein